MSKYWFKPKCCGWGIGMPIAWQGWLSLLLFVALLSGATFADQRAWGNRQRPVLYVLLCIVAAIAASVAFCLILAPKVEGGLKWRWGKQ